MQLTAKEAFAAGVPYFLICGACYAFGYWGAFGVNVLEFISLADLGKLAVFPLTVSIALVVLGLILSQLLLAPIFPPGGGNETAVGKFGFKHGRMLVALLLSVIVLIAVFGPDPVKWFVVASFAIYLATPLSHLKIFIRLLPNARVRYLVLATAILVPTMSFAYGRNDAFTIKSGHAEWIIDVARSKLILDEDAKNPISYLGVLGDVYILRESKTKDLVFVKQNENSPLFLISNNH